MDISLSPDIERVLRLKVAEGLYDSLNEAVNGILSIALNQECISQEQLNALNDEIQKGTDDADSGKETDAIAFFKDLRAEYE